MTTIGSTFWATGGLIAGSREAVQKAPVKPEPPAKEKQPTSTEQFMRTRGAGSG